MRSNIDEATFEQAQTLLVRHRLGLDLPQRQRRARNPYVFRGPIYCAACNRRMQGQYNHGAAYYRCRFPQEHALANDVSHPRNVYLREETQAERTRAETELHTGTSAAPRRMTQAEITALVHALGNIVTVLRDADPADKAEVHRHSACG
ncbi:zinc ribbon domain-containing protein [Micromonospora sp. NPDC047187]|uniref:zinc ribbon domain-containing protein n=1 Tax=Micromonospora sp. NPDC047187 TaxID=3155262 RepID=UPI0033D8464D